MARTNQLLAAVETGLAEGRQIAAERAKLEQQARQDALAQSNVDRQFGLSVFNSMLQMQQQAPKPEDPMKAAAGAQLNQLITADPDYFYGVLNNTYSDPVLLSQARQLGDMAGLKWIGDTIDTAGLRTEDRNRIAANNTLKRQLGVTPEIEDTIFQTLAAGGDMDAWVDAYNANLPEGARKMTATEGRLLGASTMQASGATVEFLAEQRFDKTMQDPKVQAFLAKADSALSRAANTTTRGSMGDEVDALTFASREITRLGLDRTPRGKALKKQYEDAATGIRSLNASPPETQSESFNTQLKAQSQAVQIALSGRLQPEDPRWQYVESAGLSREDISLASSVMGGNPDKLVGPAVGRTVERALQASGTDQDEARAIGQRLSMGYPTGVSSNTQLQIERSGLRSARDKLLTLKADSYADPQAAEVEVIARRGAALVVSSADRDEDFFDWVRGFTKGKEMTDSGLQAVLSYAPETGDPIGLSAEATAVYLIGTKDQDPDEAKSAIVTQFGLDPATAEKIANKAATQVGKK